MARPRKKGLDYFPFDVDFFDDEKIVAIAGEFGLKGEIAAIKLLCAIYRNGYFIEWSDMLRFKILRQLPNVSAELLDQILNRLVKWGFFDASLFDSVKVLTSVGIQLRYFEIIRKRNKDEEYPYLLVSAPKTPVSAPKTPQSKEKESTKEKSPNGDKNNNCKIPGLDAPPDKKRKNSGNRTIMQPPTLEEVLQYFHNSDIPIDDRDLQARLFFSYFESQEWETSSGKNIIRTWDSRANNWMLNTLKNQKKIRDSETKQSDKLSERRGTEPNATSRKGFKGAF